MKESEEIEPNPFAMKPGDIIPNNKVPDWFIDDVMCRIANKDTKHFSLRQYDFTEWELRNFGFQEPFKNLAGMTEELGELAHAMLKSSQGIQEGINGEAKELIADAFADLMIYGVNLLSKYGIDAEEALSKAQAEVLARDWKKYPKNGTSA